MAPFKVGVVGAIYSWAILATFGYARHRFSTASANRLVSACNAVVITGLAVAALAVHASDLTDRPPLHPMIAVSIECMCAYLSYDIVLGLVAGFESAPGPMLAHHAMGLAAEALVLVYGFGGFSLVVVHLAEGSTPFLHLSWALLKFGYGGTRLFFATGVALVLTFGILRVILPAWVLFGNLLTESGTAAWGAASALHEFFVLVVVIFWFLNCFWFVKLLRVAMGKASPHHEHGLSRPSSGSSSAGSLSGVSLEPGRRAD
eukprot:CAMPEP_0206042364 /NCGR_PEP_ID=MMETSP1466-20131121/6510_1 /ASSEMBLY_ACC=CAM_ASM_001126 /TAXON_ID=44452 /ORGANISM="Pavlova gyrans, Strain CCMP608" /LENGTH=259 /DNA_ID=CAMNT_0053417073 /DNA_START=40 /DNA_END=819 /DNA_ORIENTATION=+